MIDAVPTDTELRRAATLRDALASGVSLDEESDASFAIALRSAHAPTPLGIAEHKALVEAALAKMPARRRTTIARITFGALATGVALAAAIFLVVTRAPIPRADEPLARTRTTQSLFDEPFKTGETSARIDRIATARAADYRNNCFSKWGVR